MSKSSRLCSLFVQYLYAFIILCILMVVLFISPSALSLTAKPFLISNPVLLVLAVCCACIVFIIGRKASYFLLPKDECSCNRLILGLCIIALPLQFYLACNYYFQTGWDVGSLFYGADELLSGNPSTVSSYVSIYPNNILLLLITSICKQIDNAFGIISPTNGVLPFIFLNCCISVLTGWLTYKNILHFCNYRWAVLGFVFYWGLVGISPWVSIPYSDSLALFFPSLLFFLYTRSFTPPLKWILIGCIFGIAYNVKPQSSLIFIAIVLITFFHSHFPLHRVKLISGILLLLSLAASMAFPKLLSVSMGITVDSDKSFGPAHFLMMGINPETHGYYAGDDVVFSQSFPTKSERNHADMTVFFQRLKDYGLHGYLQVLRDKIAYNFNDGTFAWCCEGNFWDEIYPVKNNLLSPKIRSIYYEDGNFYSAWCTWAQFLWMAVLLFSAFSLGNRRSKTLSILQLTICGLFLFEMLFEARARYIYTCVPLFIVLAIIGLQTMYHFICRLLKKSS